jgi:hypothetical protein
MHSQPTAAKCMIRLGPPRPTCKRFSPSISYLNTCEKVLPAFAATLPAIQLHFLQYAESQVRSGFYGESKMSSSGWQVTSWSTALRARRRRWLSLRGAAAPRRRKNSQERSGFPRQRRLIRSPGRGPRIWTSLRTQSIGAGDLRGLGATAIFFSPISLDLL